MGMSHRPPRSPGLRPARLLPRRDVAVRLLVVAALLGAAGLVRPAGATSSDAPAPDPAVTALTTERVPAPLGIADRHPRLGWVVTSGARGVSQSAYQIRVARAPGAPDASEGLVWDSGRVSSAQSFDVRYAGQPLTSRTRYVWRVRVWDDAGRVSPWSATSWFETAFLDPAEFRGQWIARDGDVVGTLPGSSATSEVLLRKGFTLHAGVTSARVYVCGLGYHYLYVNGRRIGDHYLDPAFTAYDKTDEYVTWDVTPELRSGANALGVSLGHGMYTGGAADYNAVGAPWQPGQPKLKLELDVRYDDGTSQSVVTDATWRIHDGPATADNPAGESVDARLAQPGWAAPGFDDGAWKAPLLTAAPGGVLRPQVMPAVEQVEAEAPVRVVPVDRTTVIYDFGKVRAGWARIELSGAAGTQVYVRYAERMSSGSLPAEGGQDDSYILRGGGRETYEPRYGWKGYRFVEVSTVNPGGPTATLGSSDPTRSSAPDLPQISSVTGVVAHTALTPTGTFDSSSELFDRTHEAMLQTYLMNQFSYGSDTPTFEKGGWTGDNHLYAEIGLHNVDATVYDENLMQVYADTQLATGDLPWMVPYADNLGPDPVWSAAIVFLHEFLYRYAGDLDTSRRDWASMTRWTDYFANLTAPTGYVYQGNTFGDWAPPNNEALPSGSMLGTMHLFRAAEQLAALAQALGDPAAAGRYEDLAGKYRTAVLDTFYDAGQKVFRDPVGTPAHITLGAVWANVYKPVTDGSYSQTANVLGLAFGLAPQADRAAVAAHLATQIGIQGNHLATGAVGSKDVLKVLDEAGYEQLAYQVATNPTAPGWGYWMQTCHATSGWETWGNPTSGPGAYSCTAPRTYSHAFMATIDDWFYDDVAGITALAPGYRTIQVKPHLYGLTHARASQVTPCGTVASSWSVAGATTTLDVTVPVGTTAHVYVPATSAGSVTEGGVPVGSASGVRVLGFSDGWLHVVVGSGSYAFSSAR